MPLLGSALEQSTNLLHVRRTVDALEKQDCEIVLRVGIAGIRREFVKSTSLCFIDPSTLAQKTHLCEETLRLRVRFVRDE
jgi:aminoglycoside phosphotransferase family enzyme